MSKVVKYIGGVVQVGVGLYTGNAALVASGVGSLGAGAAQDVQERQLRQAQGEERKAVAISNAQQAIQRQRQIRQTLAQERVQRAIIQSRGFEGGPSGAGQSITGDTASAIGAANTQQAAAFGIAQANNRRSGFLQDARSPNTFNAIAGAADLFGKTYNSGAFEGLFGDRENG